jgi:hypothetical protein
MSDNKKPKVAIIFFGITRTLPDVINSIQQNLFDVLEKNGFEYDIFIHTYILSNPYINQWSGEKTYNYDNNAYKVLNAKYVLLENQDTVEKSLNIPAYFLKLGDWAGCAKTIKMKQYLVRNMILALYSKRQATKLFSQHKDEYEFVIFTRPDQIMHNKINPPVFRNLLNNSNIIIPKEHCYHGVNDRLCIAKPNVGVIYGYAFNHLLSYSKNKSIISEVYLRDYLKFKKINIIFNNLQTSLKRL